MLEGSFYILSKNSFGNEFLWQSGFQIDETSSASDWIIAFRHRFDWSLIPGNLKPYTS